MKHQAAFLILYVILLVGCTPTGLEPTQTAGTVAEQSATLVIASLPLITPPKPTTEDTQEPTVEVTEVAEDFSDLEAKAATSYKECMNNKEAHRVDWQDAVNGRLKKYVETDLTPFEEGTVNEAEYGIGYVEGKYWFLHFGGEAGDRYRKGEKPPYHYEPKYFFTTDATGQDYLLFFQHWTNNDGSEDVLEYFVTTKYAYTLELVFEKMGVGFPRVDMGEPSKNPVGLLGIISLEKEERYRLLEEWRDTGNIPKELSGKLLSFSVSSSEMDLKD